ncbi:MAG TPA: hypothetical protein VG939_01705 [Caulobacteraceae bacterium]|nr:hypothetical protein [Caulobacteraceae bacterium]
MSLATLRTPALARPASAGGVWKRVTRWLAMAAGLALMAVGVVGALLPGHLGVPVLVVGLVLVLRSSQQARRQFIGLQRRHPKLVFPIRRLLRREPEVMPVAWQQVLRMERMVLPRRMRPARGLRRRFFRRRIATT